MPGRLSLAVEQGHVALPEGAVLVLGASAGCDLASLDKSDSFVLWRHFSDHVWLEQQGWTTGLTPKAGYAGAVVFAPRARDLQKAFIKLARKLTSGPIIVDGTKTDGIDALYKLLRNTADVSAAYSKMHGKVFAVKGGGFSDWPDVDPVQSPDGWWRAPGVFSADGVDKASAFLAESLPNALKGDVIDLGAGWGYLTRAVLEKPAVTRVTLVENDETALQAARRNIPDARAVFVCRDALNWAPDTSADVVVTNPPFHKGRAATPELGQGFIRAAARVLKPKGALWLVANRHLPYEKTLDEAFASQEVVAQNAGFKVIRADRPRPPFKGK